MNTTTAVMAILGGILLILYAGRLLLQKRGIEKSGIEMRAKLIDFSGKHAVYRFSHGDKTITALSLQRTGGKARRNTMENIRFNPKAPKYVVIVGDRNVEWNAFFMTLFGLLAILGGVLYLL